MKSSIAYDANINHTNWFSASIQMQEQLDTIQWNWLTDTGSLTKRLHEITNNTITHYLAFNDWEDDHKKNWVRKMEWRHQGKRWISGYVIIPASSIAQEKMLLKIGENSIGDILFADPTLTCGDFLFRCADQTWSRQRTFHFKQQPLIVIETFYPEFFQAIKILQTR